MVRRKVPGFLYAYRFERLLVLSQDVVAPVSYYLTLVYLPPCLILTVAEVLLEMYQEVHQHK